MLVGVAAGCARERWPAPPPVDAVNYQKGHDAWRAEHRAGLSQVLPIVGIWPLAEGDTAFGADRSLPIALPTHVPARAGTFRRAGATINVIPDAKAPLRLDDGTVLKEARELQTVLAGPFRLEVTDVGDDRRWVTAFDTSHPAVANPPAIETYPLDQRWRVVARFDPFDRPKPVRVPDVRGGTKEYTAVGHVVFRLNGEELRLTAFGDKEWDDLFVMFKDPTNQSTTYRGYRYVTPKLAKDGWTVLDFNFATNPPCAYSQFTTCPLPPPENRLPVAVEAGLKRLPDVDGY
jgi:uncharacterized protein (DUF1684 family)